MSVENRKNFANPSPASDPAPEERSSKDGIKAPALIDPEQINAEIEALEAKKAFILGDGDLTALLRDTTLANGGTRLDLLISTVGPTAVKGLANMLLDSRIREASTTLKNGRPVIGIVRPEEVLAWYKDLRAVPGTNKFFQVDAETSARYAKIMADLENIASTKRMVKRGIVAVVLILLVLALVALLLALKQHG